MLENQKCILVYGLEKEELKQLELTNNKIIVITTEMVDMKIKDLISGLKFETVDKALPQEKVLIFNNFEDKELQEYIKIVRAIVKESILAVVTPTSSEWTFSYLIEHLIEEREWYKKQKGRV
ncbi:DUF3783 domain-containing protein [Clostridium fungisolvens]|uniref:DUF3783 domain-containing protein n=1 Tax=Clostridium fungisolvens TaxID=1604897 RepID=A0A6V8SLF9_9CLOT|nr:DUF3783 domain-containing protein [Clostridium fungisolvens]GFP78069.1 hypothetical protein bsdtw1_04262 [Clostridium fungisolvens]